VFTAVPYRGNPLAVVVDGEGLAAEEMRAFARWTNLSETTFLLPPTEDGADYRARIFTPVGELSFAGHPTLGSAHVWLATHGGDDAGGHPGHPGVGDHPGHPGAGAGMVVQECGAGLIRVRCEAGGSLAFAAPPLLRTGPVEPAGVAHAAKVLGIDKSEIVDAQWADNGPGWMAVLLADAQAVLDLQPGFVDIDLGVVGAYEPGGPCAFEVRAFFPKDGTTVEDPVTGSLNASLAEWLLRTGRATAPYVVSQGTALGRAGRVRVSVDDAGTIWVGGDTVTCIEGHVEL